ncbi:hypothetical protein GGR52DRAFT_416534 [Hypoxylon sp. FL1284]|nr:hypothetical protein GGR52DRAFT_416534 [Hypoxylon sp. FL1284]
MSSGYLFISTLYYIYPVHQQRKGPSRSTDSVYEMVSVLIGQTQITSRPDADERASAYLPLLTLPSRPNNWRTGTVGGRKQEHARELLSGEVIMYMRSFFFLKIGPEIREFDRIHRRFPLAGRLLRATAGRPWQTGGDAVCPPFHMPTCFTYIFTGKQEANFMFTHILYVIAAGTGTRVRPSHEISLLAAQRPHLSHIILIV